MSEYETRQLRSAAARLALRLRTAWRAPQLDRALARGVEPDSAELALRAKQLASRPSRTDLASALKAAVGRAHSQPLPLDPRTPIRRDEVSRQSETLMGLAERLREDRPVDVQGVAMVRILVGDGTSSLYSNKGLDSLGHVARAALRALEPISGSHRPAMTLANSEPRQSSKSERALRANGS
jgi:hypothetical protein